jgi:hypothetical protein
MASNNSGATGGIGIGGALLILFVALKLTHVVSWPWLWVLAPAWIPIGIIVAIIVIGGAVVVLRAVFGGRRKRARH